MQMLIGRSSVFAARTKLVTRTEVSNCVKITKNRKDAMLMSEKESRRAARLDPPIEQAGIAGR
jgi:hypothetical protein